VFANSGGMGQITITSSQFSGNSAALDGGAADLEGCVHPSLCFLGCFALTILTMPICHGHCLNLIEMHVQPHLDQDSNQCVCGTRNARVIITDSNFTSNTAAGVGGALQLANNALHNITGSFVTLNSAQGLWML